MSILTAKPANIPFDSADFRENHVLSEILDFNFVYFDGKKLNVVKNKKDDETSWALLDGLTDYPFIIFINDDDKELNQKSSSNISPVSINKDLFIASSGLVLETNKQDKQKYSDIKVLVDKYLSVYEKNISNFFSKTYAKYLMEHLLTSSAAMATLNSKGELNIFNRKGGEEYKQYWTFDSFLAASAQKKMVKYYQGGWD